MLSHPTIEGEVHQVADKFTAALQLFGKCHRGYNSAKYLSNEDIMKIGNSDFDFSHSTYNGHTI